MPKRIYVTVRDYNTRTGEASLVEASGRTFRIRLSEITSEVTLQDGMRVSALIDDGERSVMRVARA